MPCQFMLGHLTDLFYLVTLNIEQFTSNIPCCWRHSRCSRGRPRRWSRWRGRRCRWGSRGSGKPRRGGTPRLRWTLSLEKVKVKMGKYSGKVRVKAGEIMWKSGENPVEVGHQGWDKLCPWKKWKWRWGKYSEKVKVKAETLERWDTKADVNSGESGDKFFLWKSESGENTRDVGP